MKKIKNITKYKLIQRKRAYRENKGRERYKEWRKQKNRREQGIPRLLLKRYHQTRNEKWFYHEISAPKKFSFIENTDEVVRFIKEIESHYDKRKRVFVKLGGVEEIDYSAIVVLLSIMVKFKASNIPFNGDFPNNQKAVDVLVKSGFFENLGRTFKEQENYEILNVKSQGIHTHARKTVDSELTASVIQQATKEIWGEERRCQGVQRALIELMHNTRSYPKTSIYS